jgi:ribulose kinase
MVSRAASHLVGVGYGTLSGRAVIVRVSDGAELSSAVSAYRHGVMDGTPAASDTRPSHIDSRYECFQNVDGRPRAGALGG